MGLFSNPELMRNARSQLRWGRLMAVAAMCAVLSFVTGYSLAHEAIPGRDGAWGMQLLQIALGAQAVVLLFGGCVACVNAIHREKEMNTFDFQRVTRLTPLELTLGKLFGAPVLVYFVVLCLMPAALVGAVAGGARPTFVLAAYVVLLLGSIALHALSLVLSLLHQRGSTTGTSLVVIILAWMIIVAGSSPEFSARYLFELGSTSPFIAVHIVDNTTWQMVPPPSGVSLPRDEIVHADVFFGLPLHHIVVLLILYLSFTAWLLLPVVRNIKRDPSVYELYTPAQALGLVFYINLLMLGFFRWRNLGAKGAEFLTPHQAQTMFLSINLGLFLVLGMLLLRNRDQLRRRLRELGDAASSRLAATWPSPYLLGGMLLLGAATMGLVQWMRPAGAEWDVKLAAFRLLVMTLWLVRDLLYFQWINLTRIRRPLTMGFLYLLVFYVSTTILFVTFDLYDTPRGQAVTAIFAPAPAFVLTAKDWTDQRSLWILALLCQVLVAGFLAFLQRQKLQELAPHPAAPAAEAPVPTTG